jgi:hypothetical protein
MTPRAAMRIETEMRSATKIATEKEIKTGTRIGTGKHTPHAPTANTSSPIPTAGPAVSITERAVVSQRCSWTIQSSGTDSGVHFAIQSLIGAGPTSENTTVNI